MRIFAKIIDEEEFKKETTTMSTNTTTSTSSAEKKKVEIPLENPYKDFEKDMLQLTFDEPFLTSISMHILKQFDYEKPTAYVGVSDMSIEAGQTSYRLVMGVNPTFMAQYPSRPVSYTHLTLPTKRIV